MRSAKEAVAYMKKVHTLVRYLEICDGNMQEGSFRCDANVSVRRAGAEKLGTRAEIKNLNSFRFVEKAINYEVARQIELLEGGGKVVQETRLYDPGQGRDALDALARKRRTTTATSRIRICCRWSSTRPSSTRVRATLPELPDQKARALRRAVRAVGLRRRRADRQPRARRLLRGRWCASVGGEPKLAANWVMGELAAALNRDGPGDRRGSRVGADALGGAAASASPTARSPARSPRKCSRRCGPSGRRRRCDHRGARACGRSPTPARSRRPSTRCMAANPGAARRLPRRQGQAVRLLRRPGHEGDRRQGESGAAQRAAEEEAELADAGSIAGAGKLEVARPAPHFQLAMD